MFRSPRHTSAPSFFILCPSPQAIIIIIIIYHTHDKNTLKIILVSQALIRLFAYEKNAK